jgi:ketopantoate reductase
MLCSILEITDHPPVTLLVPDIDCVKHVAEAKGSMKFVVDGLTKYMDGFNVEHFSVPGEVSAKKIAPGIRLFTYGTLVFGEKRRLELIRIRHQNQESSGPNLDTPFEFEGLVANRQRLKAICHGISSAIAREISRRKVEIVKSDGERKSLSILRFRDEETTAKAWNAAPPIRHLIIATEPAFVVEQLLRVRHRLRHDSTILFVHRSLGVLGKVNKEVFPDVSSRPNYITSIFDHRIWKGEDDRQTNELSQMYEELDNPRGGVAFHTDCDSAETSVTVRAKGDGNMKIGPIFYDMDSETLQQVQKRQISALQLTNILLLAPRLNARLISQEHYTFVMLSRTVVDAVYQTMSVLYSCPNRDILKTSYQQKVARRMLEEASSIVRPFHPKLTY